MKTNSRLLAFLLTILLVTCSVPASIFADTVPEPAETAPGPAGVCEGLTWSITDDVLTLNIAGTLPDWTLRAEGLVNFLNRVTKVTLGSEITAISSGALKNGNFTEIVLNEGLTTIGLNAFAGTGISEITIPSTVTSLGWQIFAGCTNLKTVNLTSAAAPSIDDFCFGEVPNKLTVNYPCKWDIFETRPLFGAGEDKAPNYVQTHVYDGTYTITTDATCTKNAKAYKLCTSCGFGRVDFEVPDSKADHVFTNYVPNGDAHCNGGGTMTAKCDTCGRVTDTKADPDTIGPHLYAPITDTENGTVCTICSDTHEHTDANEDKACDICGTGMCGPDIVWGKAVHHSQKVNSIPTDYYTVYLNGSGEMYNYTETPWKPMMTQICSVRMTDGITTVGSSAFRGCRNLSEAYLPDSITVFKDYSFFNTSVQVYKLDESIGWPASLTSVEDHAFHGNNAYHTQIDSIPETITHIGIQAFNYSPDLETAVIPASVSAIGYRAFGNCEKLRTVVFTSQDKPSIDEKIFTPGHDDERTVSMEVEVQYPCSWGEMDAADKLGAYKITYTAVHNRPDCGHPDDTPVIGDTPSRPHRRPKPVEPAEPTVPETPEVSEVPSEPEVPEIPETPAASVSFGDVKETDYFGPAVNWAVEKGITAGTAEGRFSPNESCSRAQILTML
ncbi:MAG: leucine-rich repeat protein, partial [Clostridia bacterium]|nr:leucine-rich repeat protein [Clostridia bacterium]